MILRSRILGLIPDSILRFKVTHRDHVGRVLIPPGRSGPLVGAEKNRAAVEVIMVAVSDVEKS